MQNLSLQIRHQTCFSHTQIHTGHLQVFGRAQEPQFSTAGMGMRPVNSHLQFNTAAVQHWRWGDLGMGPVHSYLQFSTAAVKHWRWGDLGMRPVHSLVPRLISSYRRTGGKSLVTLGGSNRLLPVPEFGQRQSDCRTELRGCVTV